MQHQRRTPEALNLLWGGMLVLWGTLVCLGAIELLHSLVSSAAVQQLSYHDFKTALRHYQIQEVQLSQTLIRGTRLVVPASMRLYPSDGLHSPQLVRFRTVRVTDPTLTAELEAHQVRYRGQADNPTLKTLLAWLMPVGVLVLLWMSRFDGHPGSGPDRMTVGPSRARVDRDPATGNTFSDVAGVDDAKAELQEIIDFLRDPQTYAALGGRLPGGVLLVGPPGTGKTLLARAVAGEASVPFLRMNGSAFVEMVAGIGAARVRDLFHQARDIAPAIVFIDELDAVGNVRGANPMPSHDDREQTVNQLLAEMDGVDPRQGVLVLAATNRPALLDPALLRAGRFDRRVMVDRPDRRGRLHILRLYAGQVRLAPDVDLAAIAARTPGLVGSDLATVINEAALLAARGGQTAVSMAVLDAAVDRIVAGPQRKRGVMAPAEKKRVACHESGHALVAQLLPTTTPVHKVTIRSQGVATHGEMPLSPRDRYLHTKAELLDCITVLLGGRAAEHVMFQTESTAARDDLQQASALARRMVMAWGMGDQLGPYTVNPGPHPRFVRQSAQSSPAVSDATAHAIDQEAQQIVAKMTERAHQLLEVHSAALETLVHYLLVHDSIDQWTLVALLGDRHPDAAGDSVRA